MFQSNRDIHWAIKCRQLLVDPPPENWGAGYDETSIDLHLDNVKAARVWDVTAFATDQAISGGKPELRFSRFNYGVFSEQFLVEPPEESRQEAIAQQQLVCRRGHEIIVKPQGFLLWMTKERVGTPAENPRLISFVNAKSTRARTGLLVHLTAPTIHAGWEGKIALEIVNLGPFHLVLAEDDVIAQLTVAAISSPPDLSLKVQPSQTAGQQHATGGGPTPPPRTRRRRREPPSQ